MNESHDELDLDWLAFCYAVGELDAEQAAAFEALLATSQEARERLSAMVALSQHVAEVPLVAPAVHTTMRAGRRTYKRIAWLAVGSAGLLAAILLGRNLVKDAGSDLHPASGDGDAELATAWAESFVGPGESNADDEDAASPVIELNADDSLDVPDWMFAALGDEDVADEALPEEAEGEYDEMSPDALEATSPQDG